VALALAVSLLPVFVWADATPVIRAVAKNAAAMNLETMGSSIGHNVMRSLR
jgi:hypothetical protein